MRIRFLLLAAAAAVTIAAAGHGAFADNAKPAAPANPDGEEQQMVRAVITARKGYQKTLAALYDHYRGTGDKERAKWVEEEIRAFHMAPKPSYRLDVLDVPPATLEAKQNIREANEQFKLAMEYKDKGYGTEYVLNQKRAEIVFQDILAKYPTSDKIADVAYELGDLYEGKAFKQYDRAAAYFERATQWRKGTRTDARLRAARLYDKQLGERTKAIELYREVLNQDADAARHKEAERRLQELQSPKK